MLGELVWVVRWLAYHGQDFTGRRMDSDKRAASALQGLLRDPLQPVVERKVQIKPGLRFNPLDQPAYFAERVHLYLIPAVNAPYKRVVSPLDPGLPHRLTRMEVPKLFRLELRLAHLGHVAQ